MLAALAALVRRLLPGDEPPPIGCWSNAEIDALPPVADAARAAPPPTPLRRCA